CANRWFAIRRRTARSPNEQASCRLLSLLKTSGTKQPLGPGRRHVDECRSDECRIDDRSAAQESPSDATSRRRDTASVASCGPSRVRRSSMMRTRSLAMSPVVVALCLALLLGAGSSRAGDEDNVNDFAVQYTIPIRGL